jgi:hypothetical protein
MSNIPLPNLPRVSPSIYEVCEWPRDTLDELRIPMARHSRFIELLFYAVLLTSIAIAGALVVDRIGWTPELASIPDESYWNRLEDLFNGWL